MTWGIWIAIVLGVLVVLGATYWAVVAWMAPTGLARQQEGEEQMECLREYKRRYERMEQ